MAVWDKKSVPVGKVKTLPRRKFKTKPKTVKRVIKAAPIVKAKTLPRRPEPKVMKKVKGKYITVKGTGHIAIKPNTGGWWTCQYCKGKGQGTSNRRYHIATIHALDMLDSLGW
jgi:hypothetical protein